MNQKEYIFNILSKRNIPRNKIDELKLHFGNEINSKRLLCRINSLLDLLNILRKRTALDNNENLRYIIQLLDPTYLERFHHRQIIPHADNDSVSQIHLLIKTDIGSKWKEFARALKIPEGVIDNLERHHSRDISEMVEEVLQHHLRLIGNNPDLWRGTLQNALQRARRTDLSVRIDEILAQRINYQQIYL